MKKNLLKSMLVAVMTVMASSVWAAGYTRTLTEELEVAGYKAKAFYDFQNNNPAVLPTSGDLRYRDGGIWGLHNFGSGTRSGTATIPVAEGDILVLQHYNATYATIDCGTLNETLSASAGYQVYDITATAESVTFTIARYGGIVAAFVMEKDATAVISKFTINYVCDGETVKTTSGEIASGTVVNFETSFFVDDMKYILDQEATNFTVAVEESANTITVNVRKAEKFAWTAKASMGSFTKELGAGEDWEGEIIRITYPLYLLVDGNLWKKDAISNTFAVNIELTEDDQEIILVYTETEISDVRFIAEGEDIEGMSIVNDGNAAARSSQCAAGYSASGFTTITSLPLGKYKISARFYSPSSAGGHYEFISGARTIWTPETDNSNGTDLSAEVVLAQESNVIKIGQGGKTAALDFIYIQYIGEPTEDELIAAQSADYAAALAALKAQVNEYLPLIKKFFATFDKAAATALTTYFENLETALAGESIQAINDAMEALKSAATLYIAQDFTKIENYLNAMGNETLIADMTALKTAGLAYISGGDIQPVVSAAEKLAEDFKVAVPTYIEEVAAMAANGETEGKIGVNELKAAILAAQAAITPEADIVTVGEAVYNLIKAVKAYEAANDTTGITTVATAAEQAPVYNMAGQRVMNAQKGLYIVNGKKVVKK